MENEFNLGETLKGNIIRGIPYLKIKIKGIDIPHVKLRDGFDAVLDTGAIKTHITPSFAKTFNLKKIGEDIGLYPTSGYTKTNIYELEFYINGISRLFKEELKELPSENPYPIILGTGFLMRCKSLKVDFVNNEYFLEL